MQSVWNDPNTRCAFNSDVRLSLGAVKHWTSADYIQAGSTFKHILLINKSPYPLSVKRTIQSFRPSVYGQEGQFTSVEL